jgi:ATP-dependent Clp protease ATP-binding subunit ClpA
MFERFTSEARDLVARSQDEARQLHHPSLGPEHLLLSMAGGSGPGAQVLAAHGVTAAALRDRLSVLTGDDLDEAALAALGIDLERVREATEANLGPGALAPRKSRMPSGHIPFSKAAKKVLELAVREAMRFPAHMLQDSGEISSGHLLLGLLREADTGDRDALVARLLSERELDLSVLRTETEHLISDRAA